MKKQQQQQQAASARHPPEVVSGGGGGAVSSGAAAAHPNNHNHHRKARAASAAKSSSARPPAAAGAPSSAGGAAAPPPQTSHRGGGLPSSSSSCSEDEDDDNNHNVGIGAHQQQKQQQRVPPPPPPAAASAAADASLSQESNDALYKAMMNYKRMEQQRTRSLISDTQTITEAILRKQAEAKSARNVISACTQYATNAKYMQVNGGQHPRIRVFPGMHALSPDEVDVYTSLVEPCASALVTVMHNHCMSEQGMVEGFRFTMDARENNQYLPLSRRMFFRHSMVECYPNGSTTMKQATSTCEDQVILNLLLRQNELRDTLAQIMKDLHADSQNGKDADFDCMPMNMDVIDPVLAATDLQGGSSMSSFVSSFHSRRTADCKQWNPDMPELLGLYHAYVRGFNKDTMMHKLFIVTSGGCGNLSDKFYNCSVDIRGSTMTASDVLESEEAYYLRRINARNNARVLKIVADRIGLSVPWTTDSCSYDPVNPYKVATCTTETLINDMHRQRDGRISVLVKCADSTRVENGVLCCMHPAEGFWLFKGKLRHNTAMQMYGSFFGSEALQTSMPSCMNKMHSNYLWCSKVVSGGCEVCNRKAACTVLNRASSHVGKVDRSGNLLSAGLLTPMESAVVMAGGRIPEDSAEVEPNNNNKTDAMRRGSAASMMTRRFLAMDGGGGAAAASPSSASTSYCGDSASQHPRRATTAASRGTTTTANTTTNEDLYTFIDEEYLNRLSVDMQWERDNGIIHLMPIAVVYQSDVY